MLSVILNLVICAIMAFGVIFGIRRGFISMAAKPVRFVATLAIAFALCNGFSDAIIRPIVDASITNYIKDFMYTNCQGLTAENISEELPTLLKMAAGLLGINVEEIASGVAPGEVLDEVLGTLTAPVVDIISVIISFCILYFIFKLLLTVGLWFLSAVFSSGLFGLLNRILGIVFGILCAIIASWAFVSLMEFILHLPAFANNPSMADFEGGFLYSFFKEYNPVELLLSF